MISNVGFGSLLGTGYEGDDHICEEQCEKPQSWVEEIDFLIETGQMEIEELF